MVQGDVLVHVADGHVERTPRPAAEVVAAGSVDGAVVRSDESHAPPGCKQTTSWDSWSISFNLETQHPPSSLWKRPSETSATATGVGINLVSSLAFIPLTLALINVG